MSHLGAVPLRVHSELVDAEAANWDQWRVQLRWTRPLTRKGDVIVVHKLDRFARNIIVTLTTLDRLGKLGIGFVSINEQMAFTTPSGRMFLTMLAGFAQFYSDKLSWETKKGKQERKAQGQSNGLLPFGVKKNSQGIPMPDSDTYPGLLLAFRLTAEGTSERDVANALNAAGYRTTGNRGRNPFTKDTVRAMLRNRFYLGELPDASGGWLPGTHEAMLDDALYEQAQGRQANRTSPAKVCSASSSAGCGPSDCAGTRERTEYWITG